MVHSLNFKEIFLSARDLKILKDAQYGAIIEVHPIDAQFLLDYGFLSNYSLSDNEYKFVITPLGIQYINYYDSVVLEKNKEEQRLEMEEKRLHRAEICSWLALLISAIALVDELILNLLRSIL